MTQKVQGRQDRDRLEGVAGLTRDMLDTHTASHRFKKHPSVGRRVVAGPITALRISAITQGELLSGPAKRVHAAVLE